MGVTIALGELCNNLHYNICRKTAINHVFWQKTDRETGRLALRYGLSGIAICAVSLSETAYIGKRKCAFVNIFYSTRLSVFYFKGKRSVKFEEAEGGRQECGQ